MKNAKLSLKCASCACAFGACEWKKKRQRKPTWDYYIDFFIFSFWIGASHRFFSLSNSLTATTTASSTKETTKNILKVEYIDNDKPKTIFFLFLIKRKKHTYIVIKHAINGCSTISFPFSFHIWVCLCTVLCVCSPSFSFSSFFFVFSPLTLTHVSCSWCTYIHRCVFYLKKK